MRNSWLNVSLQHLARARRVRSTGNPGNFLDAMGARLGIARRNVYGERHGLGLHQSIEPTPGKLTQRPGRVDGDWLQAVSTQQ